MTSGLALTLLGFGLGALLMADRRTAPRTASSLRARAIDAQQASARASQHARELAEQWSVEQDKDRSS